MSFSVTFRVVIIRLPGLPYRQPVKILLTNRSINYACSVPTGCAIPEKKARSARPDRPAVMGPALPAVGSLLDRSRPAIYSPALAPQTPRPRSPSRPTATAKSPIPISPSNGAPPPGPTAHQSPNLQLATCHLPHGPPRILRYHKGHPRNQPSRRQDRPLAAPRHYPRHP